MVFFMEEKPKDKLKGTFSSRNQLNFFLNNTSDGVIILGFDGKFLAVNKAICKRLGYSKKEFLKLKPKKINLPEYAKTVKTKISKTSKLGKNFLETFLVSKSGEQIPFKIICQLGNYQSKKALFNILQDLTKQKNLEKYHQKLEMLVKNRTKKLQKEINKHKKTVKILKDNLKFEIILSKVARYISKLKYQNIESGIEHVLSMTSKSYHIDRSRILLFAPDGLTMNCTHEWCASNQPSVKEYLHNFAFANVPQLIKYLKRLNVFSSPDINKLSSRWNKEKSIWRNKGIKSIICVPIVEHNKAVGILAMESNRKQRTWNKRNISLFITLGNMISGILERKKSAEIIDRLAKYDTLTDLPNRFQLELFVKKNIAYAKRHKKILGLLSIDLDRFKDVNDNFGHDIGDLLLKETGARLQKIIREEDFVARIGGDEFIVMMLGLKKPNEAEIIARKIIETIKKPYNLKGKEIKITTSIGIAVFPKDAKDKAALFKNADVAMYKAKAEGRNNYQFFSAV